MNGAAAISNPANTQLTAALTGENYDVALLFILQRLFLHFAASTMRTW
jgi:hypothetical protein